MFHEIRLQLQRRAELVLSGGISRCLDDYQYPLPVSMPQGLMLIESRDHMTQVLTELHQRLAAERTSHIVAELHSMELPRGGGFRIWVDWEIFGLAGTWQKVAEAVYFGRMADKGFITELIEYKTITHPSDSMLSPMAECPL